MGNLAGGSHAPPADEGCGFGGGAPGFGPSRGNGATCRSGDRRAWRLPADSPRHRAALGAAGRRPTRERSARKQECERRATRQNRRSIGRRGTRAAAGEATADLNITLLSWPQGQGPSEHVIVNSTSHTLSSQARGPRRRRCGVRRAGGAGSHCSPRRKSRPQAGPGGVRDLSVHRRRGGLQIDRSAERTHTPDPPAGAGELEARDT